MTEANTKTRRLRSSREISVELDDIVTPTRETFFSNRDIPVELTTAIATTLALGALPYVLFAEAALKHGLGIDYIDGSAWPWFRTAPLAFCRDFNGPGADQLATDLYRVAVEFAST
jgi:hypothetical protein